MRMVTASPSRFARSFPIPSVHPRQHGTYLLSTRLRNTLSRASAFVLSRSPNRTATTSSIASSRPTANRLPTASDTLEQLPEQHVQLTSDNFEYGKWQALSSDLGKLQSEADVGAARLLVDDPDNLNDARLWLCILNYRLEKDGVAGAAAVMESLLSRGSLRTVKDGPSRAFWRALLNIAPSDNDMMENAWAYAEWLYDKHDVRWPEFYLSVMSAFLRNRQWQEGLVWHFRLAPKFGPSADAFVVLLKRFITDGNVKTQWLLRALYLASHHRLLYDEIIPFLSARGLGNVARSWRDVFVCCGDLPRSPASRQFIRYLLEYSPRTSLHESELEVAGLGKVEFPTSSELKHSVSLQDPINIYDLFNQAEAQSHTSRVPEKPYNDEYGAKYFASTWVSLDFAINSLFLLRVTSIGPLTLQALALREKRCQPLRQRLNQLEDGGINIGESSYSQALRHWVMTENDKMLKQLLRSDVHPSVFDDVKLERDVLRSAVSTGNQSPTELTMAIRLIVSADLARRVANELLLVSLRRKNNMVALGVLDIMTSGQLGPFESTVSAISSHIADSLSPSKGGEGVDARFYACIFSMLLHFRLAPSSSALRAVLSLLIRESRLKEVLFLASEVIDHYRQCQHSDTSAIRVHKIDVPRLAREEGGGEFQAIPSDLGPYNPWHPIQAIFNPSMKSRIVRRPLANLLDMGLGNASPLRFTDGIDLLAELRDRGIIVDPSKVRDDIIHALAENNAALVQFCPSHLRHTQSVVFSFTREYGSEVSG
ncbi:hypothetical protein B0T16DRAFT_387142 [Cercophora newfieldiana]|uniref:Uncharacterized protein n=1 Tax=Cercophora newfieldiana TaxID=92897 RepID=A0AA40CU98_9PEZI|nr:hypothetical protein B0T16DRAFT_387142 [Cercophora newfieldiana]